MTDTSKEINIRRGMSRCRHFRGIQHDTCEAGVSMRPRSCSCLLGVGFPGSGPACGLVSYPTRAEVEAEMAEDETAFAGIEKARAAIVKVHGKARGVAGSIGCPVCSTGKLLYSIASNGHIHAACSTEKCVRWME